MTQAAVGVFLALAAVSLGLRTTSVLIPRVHPLARMFTSIIIGTVFVIVTLQLCDSYGVHDLGLGLLVSLSPVGVFDVTKWWFRWRGAVTPPH
jgi:hypothetical protein